MRFISTLLLILVSSAGFSQILNVEKVRIKGDSANYFVGNIGVDFSINNRNLSDQGQAIYFIGLNASSDIGYLSEHHSFFLLSKFQYNATSEQDINSTGYGHFRVTFLRQRSLSYETFAQVQYDQGRGMVFRRLIGGGIRQRIYEEKNSTLHVGTGIMYELETWEIPDGLVSENNDSRVTVDIAKSTSYLSSRVSLNKYISLNAIAYYQTGYDTDYEFFRHRFSLDAGVLTKITSRLAFRTTAGFTYENRPVVSITKLVYSVTNGIQVSF